MKNSLKEKISKQFKNTKLGFQRIRKNLNIINYTDEETTAYLKKIIISTDTKDIETKGENYYFKCLRYNSILTININTLTVITAKQLKTYNKSFQGTLVPRTPELNVANPSSHCINSVVVKIVLSKVF